MPDEHNDTSRGNGSRSEEQDQTYENNLAYQSGRPLYWAYEEYWLIPGPFTGFGPRGYTRSDERIFEEVCDRLAASGQLDASNMEVNVQNGEVVLRGTANSRRDRRLAEAIADSVMGIRDVRNELNVRPAGQPATAEANRQPATSAIAQPAQHRQTAMPPLPKPNQAPRPAPAAAAQDNPNTAPTPVKAESNQKETPKQQDDGKPKGTGIQQLHLLKQGLPVVGNEGHKVGYVKEVRKNDFLVDRAMARDIYVPFSAVEATSERGVMLKVTRDEVNQQAWKKYPLLGAPPPSEDNPHA